MKPYDTNQNDTLKMKVKKHTHYRLALAEVGYSLRKFKGSRELFDIINDILEGSRNLVTSMNMR